MYIGYAWTQKQYEKGNWTITERIVSNGQVKEFDWCFYKHSMETRIEAVAEILDEYPNAKFDPWMDEWYLCRTSDYVHEFIIWNSDVYSGPHGEKWTDFEESEDEEEPDYYWDEEEDL